MLTSTHFACRRFTAILRAATVVCVVVMTACAVPEANDDPAVRLSSDGETIELFGLSAPTLRELDALQPDGWHNAFALYTAEAAARAEATPMLGEHLIRGEVVEFRPRFPLRPGMDYVARYKPPSGGAAIEQPLRTAEIEGEATTLVTAIYPSVDVWPMNQLKMYVHFSAPMRSGRAFDHISLIDEATGEPVEQPFVTVQEELWDRQRRVLTVLFDPARIKRGLAPHLEAGLPLQTGRSYRLVVAADIPDVDGRPLADSFSRSFAVGEQDRIMPSPATWSVTIPAAGSVDPLVIDFGEPMDHGLLRSLLAVRRSDGTGTSDEWTTRPASTPEDEIDGTVQLSRGESVWSFSPTTEWGATGYELVVPAILEDLAGNTMRGLFDADLEAPPGEFAAADEIYFHFRPGRR